jgi:hypothetical protein
METYAGKNQLSDTEMIVGGLVAVVVIGGLIYYFATKNAAASSASTAGNLTQAQVNAQFPQTAGMTPQQTASFLSGDDSGAGGGVGS